MLKKLYLGLGIGALSLYAGATMFGWEMSSASKRNLPKTARTASGKYNRTHLFWASGYHGGK
ncbi:MAG: hypothetical protein AAF517_21540 [Planctomycetota bacterium]